MSLERTDLGREDQAKERQKGNREEPWGDKREIKREEENKEEDVVLSCKNLAKQKVLFIRPYPGIVYEAVQPNPARFLKPSKASYTWRPGMPAVI